MSVESYCSVSECEEPTRQGRMYCEFHRKRFDRGQSLTAPKVERLSLKDRLLEAAFKLADADAEDDRAYERAARELLKTARQAAPVAHGELVRRGMAEARARGAHMGRKPALSPQEAKALVEREGSVAGAARARGVSRWAVWRAIARGAEGNVTQQAGA